jgi:membrane associated rhomboid family serine protease
MIPVGDNDLPGRRFPIATLLLVIINALVFLYEISLPEAQLNNFIINWGVVPRDVIGALSNLGAPNSLQELLTLITSQFIHGGWAHILGNMAFLWIFGDDIEDTLGSILYVVFYLVCGIVAGLAQVFVLSRFTDSLDVPSIGASGAIAGVLGAYLILYPTRRVTVLTAAGQRGLAPMQVPALIMIGLWFVEQLFAGVAALSPTAASGIGYWAHIGGFVAGLILILPWRGRQRQAPGGVAAYR